MNFDLLRNNWLFYKTYKDSVDLSLVSQREYLDISENTELF